MNGLLCTSLALALLGATATERIELKSMPAKDALTLHARVLGVIGNAVLAPAPDGKSVVVTDTKDRIARLRLLIGWLDTPGATSRRLYVRPTQYRDPTELATLTRRVFGEFIGREVSLAPDDRSGMLIVRAKAAEYRSLDRFLRRLDVPPRDDRRIFVLPGRTSIPLPGR